MYTQRIVSAGAILLLLVLAATPVSAVMATSSGSGGVNRGDYNLLAIYETKDLYTKSNGGEYVAPWIGIVPNSDSVCDGSRRIAYRYRLLTPEGNDYNKVVYNSVFDAGGGLQLSGNSFSFTNNRAISWWRVATLISNAEKNGMAWQGTWTEEYYFGDFDCKLYEYTGWKPAGSKTFTLTEDAVVSTPTPQVTSSYTPATPTYSVTTTVQTPKMTYGTQTPTGSFTGDWTSNFGTMFLVQSGSEVTGTYDYKGNVNTIEGAMNGNVLTGTWTEPGKTGEFQLTLSADGTTFTGNWKYSGSSNWDGSWTGSRTTGSVPAATRTSVPTKTPLTPQTTVPTTTGTPVVVTPPSVLNTCPGTGTTVYAESRTMQQGKTVTIPVMVCNAQDVANMDMTITYDTSVLSFSSATKGSLNSNSLFESNEPSKGTVKISFASSRGFSGSGSIAFLTFNVVGSSSSTSPITISITTASTSSGQSLTIPATKGNFVVGTPTAGDIDGDNQLTARDALAALQISVGKRTTDMVLDVTGDGSVNSMDAQKILKMIVKKA